MNKTFIVVVAVCLMSLLNGCAPDPYFQVNPIPSDVKVNGVAYEVIMRQWCNITCTIMPYRNVYWELKPDGRIKVMSLNEELRFERGYLISVETDDTPHWVNDNGGEYLIATDRAFRAYIIHYPTKEKEN